MGSRSSVRLMLRKLPVHITDRLQNASLTLRLFLSSRHFHTCSLLFPLIWSRCCSCWKMEVCVFYEREAGLGLPGQPLSPRLCQGLRPLGWGKHLLCLTPTPGGVCWSGKVTTVLLHYFLGFQNCLERGCLSQKSAIAP